MSEIYQMTKEELFKIYPDTNGLTEEKAKQLLIEKGENILGIAEVEFMKKVTEK